MRSAFIILLLIAPLSVMGQKIEGFFNESDVFLKAYVDKGRVNYEAIKRNQSQLDELLNMAQEMDVDISQPEIYKSFWINVYNLAVIKGITLQYPIDSPLNVSGFFDKVKYSVGRKELTLNEIENDMLRAPFPDEARFHFVLVCAGLGCPPIISTAYRPSLLEEQLEAQTRKAINDKKFIKVEGDQVRISQIFEWYEEDFTRDGKSILSFLNNYRKSQLPENVKISYYPYDWSLNQTE